MGGDVRGEYGWVEPGGGVARLTKYTADRRGYRVRHVDRVLQEEQENPRDLFEGEFILRLNKYI